MNRGTALGCLYEISHVLYTHARAVCARERKRKLGMPFINHREKILDKSTTQELGDRLVPRQI